jgi:hypothetical protein
MKKFWKLNTAEIVAIAVSVVESKNPSWIIKIDNKITKVNIWGFGLSKSFNILPIQSFGKTNG